MVANVTAHEMSLTLTAILVFLTFAHLGGFALVRLKQPAVVGEIFGGLILGPTVFGLWLPEIQASLFSQNERVPVALSLIYNFGLIVLMFCSGLETENLFRRGDRKAAYGLAFGGTLIPLLLAALVLPLFPLQDFQGPNGDALTIQIILGCSLAVTSLPVISRIFMDLGLSRSPFASLVLSASLLDDIILYGLMSVALTLSKLKGENHFGLIGHLFQEAPFAVQTLASVIVHFVFMWYLLKHGHRFFGWLISRPLGFILSRQPTSALLTIMLIVCLVGHLLGIPYVLSAFAAGALACRLDFIQEHHRNSLRTFSFSFFIPIYFAYVGFRLDLAKDLAPFFTLGFIAMASLIKGFSIWTSAKALALPRGVGLDLAVTMNARGGPGIVLASVAFDAQIINGTMYVSLVIMAILTSMLAGSWLQHRLQKGALNHELRN